LKFGYLFSWFNRIGTLRRSKYILLIALLSLVLLDELEGLQRLFSDVSWYSMDEQIRGCDGFKVGEAFIT
jgi:hypothetical protein